VLRLLRCSFSFVSAGFYPGGFSIWQTKRSHKIDEILPDRAGRRSCLWLGVVVAFGV